MVKGVTPWMFADEHTKYGPVDTILSCIVSSGLKKNKPFLLTIVISFHGSDMCHQRIPPPTVLLMTEI